MFTTESAVRLRFQLTDTTITPAALIEQCIDDAHERVLALLAPGIDPGAPPPLLSLGECLLAGACVLQALAAKDAAVQKQITIGGQRLEPGQRFGALLRAAAHAEDEAWETLGPFLIPAASPPVLATTPTQPVLGG